MSYEEWKYLNQHFETVDLLAAVNLLYRLINPPGEHLAGRLLDLRRNLIQLYQLATDVVDKGVTTNAQEMFDLSLALEIELSDLTELLASTLETELSDLIESLAAIQRLLSKLNALRPDSLTSDE
ncbi:hypothetical protein [Acaryochloris marina]|uniref:hypothetical protein n=1 Tax=Acaryochloris marina TaxID=155978 RepID=UPI0006746FE9|nr:hypothetical protein [Acaryochloris marina]